MLGIWSLELLLGNGEHRESRSRKGVGPLRERRGRKVVRQERRIQHYIAGNVSNDGFVEHPVPGSQHCLAVSQYVPGESDAGGKVVVVWIVDPIHV